MMETKKTPTFAACGTISIEETRALTVHRLPYRAENSVRFIKDRATREEEKSLPAFKLRTRGNERFHPFRAFGDYEGAKTVESKLIFVDGLRPRRLIRDEFAVHRGQG